MFKLARVDNNRQLFKLLKTYNNNITTFNVGRYEKEANIKIQRRVKQLRSLNSVCIDSPLNGRAFPLRQNRLSFDGRG